MLSLLVFFSVSFSGNIQKEWSDFFEGEPAEEYTGVLNQADFPKSYLNHMWFHDCIATDFTDRLIGCEDYENNFNMLIETCFFERFYVRQRGGIFFMVNRGNLTFQKICAHEIELASYTLAGSVIFTVYHEYYNGDLVSFVACPGYDKHAMSIISILGYNVKFNSINSTNSACMVAGLRINVWGYFSYCQFSSHINIDQYTEYIFLCQSTDTMFTNFINNSILYDPGSIYACENDYLDQYCGIAGCSFVSNVANYLVWGTKVGPFFMTNCFVDEGILNNGLWTNMVNVPQTIVFTQYSTRGVCETPNITISSSIPTLGEITFPTVPTPGVATAEGTALKTVTYVSTGVAGVGVCGVFIWATKKILKKIVKKGLKSQLFGTDSSYNYDYEEEEETDDSDTVIKETEEKQEEKAAQAKAGAQVSLADHGTSSISELFKASDERELTKSVDKSDP